MIRFPGKISRSGPPFLGHLSIKVFAALLLPGALPAAYAQQASTTSPPTLPPVVVEAPPQKVVKAKRKLPVRRPSRAAATSPGRSETPTTTAASQGGEGGGSVRAEGQTPVISPTTISTPVGQIPNSITVITREELQQEQRRTAPDALQTVPGLNIVQTGGPGGLSSVLIRGTNSNQVKVLVDGVDVSNSSDSRFDFSQLLTNNLARIEVLRGPQSGLYGSDAIGGVISFITQKGEGPAQAYASVEGGSYGAFNQSTGVSGSTDRFNYAFNIAHYRVDELPVTPYYLVPPGEARLDNSYDNMTYSTKLGFEASKDVTVNFVASYIDSTYKFNGLSNCLFTAPFTCYQEPENSTQHYQQFWTRGEGVWSLFDGRFTNYFGLSYNDIRSNTVDPWPGDASASIYEGERVKYDWRGVAELAPGQTFLVGLERKDESLDIIEDTSASTGRHSTGDTGAWAQIQSEWEKRVFLNANIRFDDDDSFGGHTTWRLAGAYIAPYTETKLKASYGAGFKAPTLYDLYVNIPAFNYYGNPNLKPETSEGFDAGFEQPLFEDRVRFGSTYFHNDIKDLIQYTFLPSGISTLENVGKALTYGAESFASFAVTPEWKLRVDYTYTMATDQDTGQELLRRPKNKVSVTSIWKALDDLTLSATLNYVGPWQEQSIANNYAPGYISSGYTTVNLAANYAATENITLFGRIDNLFDRQYENPAGYLQPGFGIYAGVKIKGYAADLIEPLKQ